MSKFLSVHIGCYVEMPKVKQEFFSNVYRCSSLTCINHKKMDSDYKFCPECGSKGEEDKIKRVIDDTVSWYQFAEENDINSNELVPINEGRHLISNKVTKDENFAEDEEGRVFSINSKVISTSITEFISEHKHLLDKFEDKFGITLQVQYGAVSYYM